VADVKKGERRHEHPEEEPDPAEPRHGKLVDPPAARDVDHAEPPRHPPDGGRQQDDDREGNERAPEDLEVIAELIEDAEVRAGRRKHGASVLRAGDAIACEA